MEEKIISLFLFKKRLKFNEIEKSLRIRSNKLTYHLKKLIKRKILIKNKEYYYLSETAEYLIPYISDKKSILSAVLVIIKKQNKVFLIERKKRPFMEKLSLPGGRILIGESIKKATERILKEKFNIKCNFKKINSITLEHVKKNNKIIHSFFLILVTATTKDKIKYLEIEKNKKSIIKSDYHLIKNNLRKEIKIKEIITPD